MSSAFGSSPPTSAWAALAALYLLWAFSLLMKWRRGTATPGGLAAERATDAVTLPPRLVSVIAWARDDDNDIPGFALAGIGVALAVAVIATGGPWQSIAWWMIAVPVVIPTLGFVLLTGPVMLAVSWPVRADTTDDERAAVVALVVLCVLAPSAVVVAALALGAAGVDARTTLAASILPGYALMQVAAAVVRRSPHLGGHTATQSRD